MRYEFKVVYLGKQKPLSYFNYLVSITAGEPEIPDDICNHVLRSPAVDSLHFRAS